MESFFRFGQALVTAVIVVTALLGLLILARIILLFFGQLKTVPGYEQVINLTKPFILSVETGKIETPYDGQFDLSATITLLLIIVLESFLSVFRGVLGRRSSRLKQ